MSLATEVLMIAIIGAMCASQVVSSVNNSAEPKGIIYLRDFSKLEPRGSVSVRPMQGKWELRPLGAGNVLYSSGSWEVRDVTYPLDRKGWYDIYIGLVEKPYPVEDPEYQGIHVKLTGDKTYMHIHGGRTGIGAEWENAVVDEIFWKRADITGQDVTIYQPYGRFFKPAGGIAYVKLVPRSAERVEKDRKDFEKAILSAGTKEVCGMNDFWTWTCSKYGGIEPKDTQRTIDNHKDAGMGTVFFQVNGGGVVQYHSKVSQWVFYDPATEPRPFIKATEDILQNHDPLKVASEHAHKIGLKFMPWFRMTNEYNQSDLIEYCRKFKHLMMQGTDGKPIRWQSFAYPEIRDHKLAIMKEMVTEYNIDGLLLDYLRTLPCIGYDPPVIEAYVKKYGVDPLKVPSERSSLRWKKFRAEYMTTFMRDLRKIVDAEEKKTGREIEIAARVTPRENLWKGMDIETWIKEGLVDTLIVSNNCWHEQRVVLKPFQQMAKGTKCKIYGGINPYFAGGSDHSEVSPDRHKKDVAEIIAKRMSQGPTNLEYVQMALDYYAQGADGVVFYESEALTSQPPMFPGKEGQMVMFKQMSNPKQLLSYLKELERTAENK